MMRAIRNSSPGYRSVVALAAATLVAAGSQAVAVSGDGARIVEVTIYPDRAEVVREVELTLPAGRSTVEFPNIPWGVEGDSIRVTAHGVPAILGTIEVRPRAHEPAESSDLRAAREELRRVESEMARLGAAVEIAGTLREFLSSLSATTAERTSESLVEGRADPEAVAAIYELIGSRLGELAEEETSRARVRQGLEEALRLARARLAAAQPAGAILSRVATVELYAETPGPLVLRLAYVTPQASWRPAYRATLDPTTNAVEFVTEAVVRQTTGEAWGDVKLSLSTASPVRGVRPPELSSLLLRTSFEDVGGFVPILGRNHQDLLTTAPGVIDSFGQNLNPDSIDEIEMVTGSQTDARIDGANRMSGQVARHAAVKLVRSSYNVSFQPPGDHDLPSEEAEHRIALQSELLSGDVTYRTVPGWDDRAYLVVNTTAPEDYPLLAGPVRVFMSGAYLGSFALEETGPGAAMTLPFGVDNRISVERAPLPQSHRVQGIAGRERRVSYAFRTTVENLHTDNVTVILEDRLPISEDEQIRVATGRATTPGSLDVQDRPGVREWTLKLSPGEEREVVLEYVVRFPRDIVIAGLE